MGVVIVLLVHVVESYVLCNPCFHTRTGGHRKARQGEEPAMLKIATWNRELVGNGDDGVDVSAEKMRAELDWARNEGSNHGDVAEINEGKTRNEILYRDGRRVIFRRLGG